LGGAHKDSYSFIVCDIQNIDDGLEILKARRLLPSLLLGHVINTEELIVTE
jgi:hypothetical protein